MLDVPAVGAEALAHVLLEGEVGAAFDRDVVVVVEEGELRQAERTGEGAGLGGDTFHEVTVADVGVGAVVDDGVAGAVEARRQHALGDGHADRVGDARPERPSRDLDAGREAVFGMAWRLAAPLAEVLDLVQGQVVAGEVEEAVEQHGGVAGGEHKAVTVGPGGVGGVVAEEARPEHVGHGRGAHRSAGMPGVGRLNGVHGEGANRVDCLVLQGTGGCGHGWALHSVVWSGASRWVVAGATPAGRLARSFLTRQERTPAERAAAGSRDYDPGTHGAASGRIHANGRGRKAHARDRGGGHHPDGRQTRGRGDPLPAGGRGGRHPRCARNGALAPRRADHRRDPGERRDRAGADAAPLPGHRHGGRPRGAGAGRARDRWLPAGRHQRRYRAGVRRGLPAQVDRGAPVRRPEEHRHEHARA